jgi:hypothetical protein
MAKKKEVKKIGLGLILSWIFGILFFIGAFKSLIRFNLDSFLTLLIMGAFIFPPLLKIYEEKFNFKISRWLKIIVIIIGLSLVMSFSVSNSINSSSYVPQDNNYNERLDTSSKNIPYQTIKELSEKGEILTKEEYQFTDVFGDHFFIVGEIKNSGDSKLEGGNFASGWGGKTRINVDFYNSDNQMVETKSQVFWKNYLNSNEITPFVVCVENEFNIKNYEINVDEESTKNTYYEKFEITEENLIKNKDDEIRITGKIKNTGSSEKSAEIMVILYDTNGKILAVKTDYLGFEIINPNEIKSFSISIPNEKDCSKFNAIIGQNQKVENYKIYVQANLGVIAE